MHGTYTHKRTWTQTGDLIFGLHLSESIFSLYYPQEHVNSSFSILSPIKLPKKIIIKLIITAIIKLDGLVMRTVLSEEVDRTLQTIYDEKQNAPWSQLVYKKTTETV